MEEAITAALKCEDIRSPMRVRRNIDDDIFRLKLKQKVSFSSNGTYNRDTSGIFQRWLDVNEDALFDL
ncbi:unnamed protein product [Adineta ricciae]|uniref:Uncharacterized protein n=1 Tax=Adineta ricciae TaxID=249248 RepID=A0A813QQI1_ADIRI|nr:unnamed protein product [Adineta ricciae]